MALRIEKILVRVQYEAHERQVKETIYTSSERPERFYKSYPD